MSVKKAGLDGGAEMGFLVRGVIKAQEGQGNMLRDSEGDKNVTHLTFAGTDGMTYMSVRIPREKGAGRQEKE